jgi:predicted RNase H-like nuclease (RuvC/YqgF family)
MAEVKVTDHIAQQKGLTKLQVIAQIKAGKIKGRPLTEGSRIYLIDDSEIPYEKPPDHPPVKFDSTTDTKPIENPQVQVIQPDKPITAIDYLIARTEKQKILQSKYIELQEIRGLRDKPEKLKAKETDLNEREIKNRTLEASLSAKDTELKKLEQTLTAKKQVIDQGFDTKIKEIETKVAEKEKRLTSLNEQIQIQSTRLEDILCTIAQTPDIVEPYVQLVRAMKDTVEHRAMKYSQASDNTQNSQLSDHYLNRANKAWGLSDKLQKVFNWLKSINKL